MKRTRLIEFTAYIEPDGSIGYEQTLSADDVPVERIGEAVGLFQLAAMRCADAVGGGMTASDSAADFERGVEKGLARTDGNRQMRCCVEELP